MAYASSKDAVAESRDEKQWVFNKSLIALLDDAAERCPNQEAVVSLHQGDQLGLSGAITKPLRWTYSQLKSASDRLAAYLSKRGVRRENQIVAILYNEAEWALLFWASARLSCQFVPLDPRLFSQNADAVYLLRKIKSAAIFVSNRTICQQVDEALAILPSQPSFKCIIDCAESGAIPHGWTMLSNTMLEPSSAVHVPDVDLQLDDTLLVLFTSGTESLPKACPHTSITIGTPSLMLIDQWGLGHQDSLCQHLPTFHIFNIVLDLAFWLAGGTVIFPSSSFDPAATLEAIRTSPKVHVPCVPTMVQALAAHTATLDSSLCAPFSIILGGAPITPDILDISKALGPERIVAGYGTTEAVATLIRLINVKSIVTTEGDVCIGKPRAGARVRICQPGSRIPIRRGQIGELHQGGPPLIKGYIDATAEQLSCFYEEDGVNWMATGDQGYIDEGGEVYLLGRYKDLIIRGGENISPVKIEQCLGRFPEIIAAHVVGIPDPVAGEVPVAVIKQNGSQNKIPARLLQSRVVTLLGQSFSPAMILDLQDNLGVSTYPTTTSGKVQKSTLRRWVVDYLGKQASQRLSSADLPTELTALWLAVSGLTLGDITLDTPVQAFADSIMMIQFLYLVSKGNLGRLTQQELGEANTIRKQARLLTDKKKRDDEPSVNEPAPDRVSDLSKTLLDPFQVKQVVSSTLNPLGFSWDDVDEVIPMTDYIKHFSRDKCRPSSWNLRAAFVAQSSITMTDMEVILRLWLQRHPLLRATTASYSEDLELYLVMRLSEPWLKFQIIHGGEVEDDSAVETYALNDPDFDWVNATTGPLFKATILRIRASSNIGLVLHFHHAIFDGLALFAWAQDLKELLAGKRLSQIHTLPYRTFAHVYQQYRTSMEAEKSVDFHVQRLRGLSLSADALWPRQKAPGWIKGDAQGWIPPENFTGERKLLDGDQSLGAQGINRSIRLPRLPDVREVFEVTPPTIAKCACALVNLHITGKDVALFTGVDSGRFWPTANTDFNVSPFEIDGPTMAFYANCVRVMPGETTHKFMLRIQREQGELSVHAHASLDAIKRKLEELDSGTWSADVVVLDDLFHRQTFNWLLQRYTESEDDPIRLIQSVGRTDLGFMWFPCLQPNNVLELNVTWDDAQLTAKEVYDITTKYMCAVAWLSDPDNMHKPVAQCRFQGYEGIRYWTSEKLHR